MSIEDIDKEIERLEEKKKELELHLGSVIIALFILVVIYQIIK